MQKKKTHFRLFILQGLLLAILAGNASGQTTVLKYLREKPGGALIRLLQVQKKNTLPGKEQQAEYQYELDAGGKRISFQKNEYCIGNSRDVIYSIISNTDSDGNLQKKMYSYHLENATLKKIGSIDMPNYEYGFYPTSGSRNILVSDESEGLGYELVLYDPQLSTLAQYRPFGEKGFSHSINCSGENNMVFVFYPLDKTSDPKMVSIDLKSGKVIFELRLAEDNQTISDISMIGDYILVRRHREVINQELLCYNRNGSMLWKKNEYVYAMAGMLENNQWYALTLNNDSYWFINIETGENTAKYPISYFIKSNHITDKTLIDLSENYRANGISLVVTRKDEQGPGFLHELFSVKNTRGKVIKEKALKSGSEVIYFTRLFSTTIINNSNNQIIYSYEN